MINTEPADLLHVAIYLSINLVPRGSFEYKTIELPICAEGAPVLGAAQTSSSFSSLLVEQPVEKATQQSDAYTFV